MKKKTTSIIASAILLLAGIQTASAAVVPCLGEYTVYESNPANAKADHWINKDGTIHIAAYNTPGFTGVDVHSQYIVYYADGTVSILADYWENDIHVQRGINADVQPCGNIVKVKMECTVYRHGQVVVPIGYARIIVTPPAPITIIPY